MDEQVALLSSALSSQMEVTDMAGQFPGIHHVKHRHQNPWELITKRRRAMARSVHASCWCWGLESEAMWRLYCHRDGPAGQGLALRTTLASLEASVAWHNLYVSPVSYRHYHEGPAFDDELDPFLHKRKGFEHEHEVRLLRFDAPHFHALNTAVGFEFDITPPAELPHDIYIDWSPWDVIDAIVVSPYSTANYEAAARHAITAVDPSLAGRVVLSVLSERRYGPDF